MGSEKVEIETNQKHIEGGGGYFSMSRKNIETSLKRSDNNNTALLKIYLCLMLPLGSRKKGLSYFTSFLW